MGQYYKPLILNKKKTKPVGYLTSWDFGSGAKLMEHSWMLNEFVGAFESKLINNPQAVVWAGDYADNEPFNTLTGRDIKLLTKGDTAEEIKEIRENGVNLYTLCGLVSKIDVEKTETPKRFKYLINHDKKTFINKTKTPLDSDGWQIHPLPLLTCEGNGLGGGDFRGESELVGAWARDVISLVSKKTDIPKGFTELIFDLKE